MTKNYDNSWFWKKKFMMLYNLSLDDEKNFDDVPNVSILHPFWWWKMQSLPRSDFILIFHKVIITVLFKYQKLLLTWEK